MHLFCGVIMTALESFETFGGGPLFAAVGPPDQVTSDARARLVARLSANTSFLDSQAALNNRNHSLLNLAAFYGNGPAVHALLAAGADAGHADRSGHTPLHHAAFCRACTQLTALSIVQELLAAGARWDVPDTSQKRMRPADIARGRGWSQVVGLLESAGNAQNRTSHGGLHRNEDGTHLPPAHGAHLPPARSSHASAHGTHPNDEVSLAYRRQILAHQHKDNASEVSDTCGSSLARISGAGRASQAQRALDPSIAEAHAAWNATTSHSDRPTPLENECCGGFFSNVANAERPLVWDGHYHPLMLANLHARGVFVLRGLLDAAVVARLHTLLEAQAAGMAQRALFNHPLGIEHMPGRVKLWLWPNHGPNTTSKSLRVAVVDKASSTIITDGVADANAYLEALGEMAEALEGSIFAALSPLFFLGQSLTRLQTTHEAFDPVVPYHELYRKHLKYVVSGSAYPGAPFQNPHWDVTQKEGAEVVTINVNTVDIPDTSWAPIEIWPTTHLINPKHVFPPFGAAGTMSNPRPEHMRYPQLGEWVNRVCYTCYPEMNALTNVWPSSVMTGLRRGDVIVRNPSAWHRGTAHEASGPRHLLAFGFKRA